MPVNSATSRREFLKGSVAGTLGTIAGSWGNLPAHAADRDGYVSLFDGKTLKGWHARPRIPPGAAQAVDPKNEFLKAVRTYKGKWEVRDGVLIGGQDGPRLKHPKRGVEWGLGGFLMADRKYGDFELMIDARPDWPVDTGIYLRATDRGQAFQVLLDHREDGGIGFIYGNSIGAFNTRPYGFTSKREKGKLVGLVPKPVSKDKLLPVKFAATAEVFLKAWKVGDWNTFKIRCVGKYPLITTWINGEKICEFDAATFKAQGYDRDAALKLLGPRGRIALEVHDGDEARWAKGAVSRWRNIRLKGL
jgi:hypothetical protein